VLVVEAFESMSADQCTQWQTQLNPSQEILRDDGSVKTNLSMIWYDVVVLDRNLKITYRGGPYYDSTVQQAVTAQLSSLK
jgi:hypothetical protein